MQYFFTNSLSIMLIRKYYGSKHSFCIKRTQLPVSSEKFEIFIVVCSICIGILMMAHEQIFLPLINLCKFPFLLLSFTENLNS